MASRTRLRERSILQDTATAPGSALCGFTCESLRLLRTVPSQLLPIPHLLLIAYGFCCGASLYSSGGKQGRLYPDSGVRVGCHAGGCHRLAVEGQPGRHHTPLRAQGSPTARKEPAPGASTELEHTRPHPASHFGACPLPCMCLKFRSASKGDRISRPIKSHHTSGPLGSTELTSLGGSP